ncbi:MAG: phosphate ABC transporter permease PstA [Moorea sp. SIO1G6]|uniref:phosphate ABC transporter permease PstA n=1 Tax=Moorena sp. SIO1G6 TaxID=2607840 RepID=UPI0013C03DE6|nr:phosphate ABC transporter permease PstA [Moorena sp. SIO1G6]NES81026.1 phosphate ABC transporter permease PstA [Moorena sp. SIO2B7]NET63363.1 phosphate ABC transporter permease PstA [Moorena sp. SIO1G6]
MALFSSHSHAAHPSKGSKKRKFLSDSRNHRHRSKIAYRDRVLRIIVWFVALSVAASFAIILGHLVWYGSSHLSWEFVTTDPENAGREGGIASILVSTALILGVCLAVALPLGLGTAILLAEFTATNNLFSRLVRRSLDMLAGVPSIVFGLFGNAFFCVTLGLGFSILSGGLTLACMVLPILIRSIEEGLRAVPEEYRLGAASLGISRTSTLIHLLLPAAVPSLVAGLILGVGRVIAETAALIYTSGYVDRTPTSLFDSGRALSLHIYELSMNVPGGDDNAYASAVILVIVILLINTTAIYLGKQWHDRSLQE